MLRRLNDIAKFPEQDKNCILYSIDEIPNNVKTQRIEYLKKPRWGPFKHALILEVIFLGQ